MKDSLLPRALQDMEELHRLQHSVDSLVRDNKELQRQAKDTDQFLSELGHKISGMVSENLERLASGTTASENSERDVWQQAKAQSSFEAKQREVISTFSTLVSNPPQYEPPRSVEAGVSDLAAEVPEAMERVPESKLASVLDSEWREIVALETNMRDAVFLGTEDEDVQQRTKREDGAERPSRPPVREGESKKEKA